MPISLKNIRGCASPSSTAICSPSPHSVIPHHRLSTTCTSDLPITPRSLYRKPPSESPRRKSYDEIRDYLRSRRSSSEIRRSPPRSSRYLLAETASFHPQVEENNNNKLAIVISEPVVDPGPTNNKQKYDYRRDVWVRPSPVYRAAGQQKVKSSGKDERVRLREREIVKSASVSSAQSGRQVVILRVSLHCKGCVGKLRKHLSRMEGVESFDIDLETKRVRVKGSMSPLDVLTSISKVKNAQFWPSPATSASSLSSSSSSGLSRTEISSV